MHHLYCISQTPDDTDALGRALGTLLRVGDIVAIEGELGAGKTQLVRAIAAGLGLDPAQVSSPTFVIVTEYARPASPHTPARCPLVHADAYRLGGPAPAAGAPGAEGSSLDQLDALGFDDLILGAAAAVEWASRVGPELARRAGGADQLARVTLEHAGPERRRVELALPRSYRDRDEWAALTGLISDLNVAAGEREATTCRITGRPVAADSPTWPFFDERARLADLDRWFTGSYRVSRPVGPSDEGEGT